MKKQLIALSLVAATGLIAQDGYSNSMGGASNGSYTQNQNACGDPCNPCKPCCVPKPKKCIDCECYVPAYYDLQCDWGMIFSVDFLYWYARETNLSYAATVTNLDRGDETLTAPVVSRAFSVPSLSSIDTSWDPGFRIALGWNSDCDGWDWLLTWTWMRNCESNSKSVAAGQDFLGTTDATAIMNPWISGSVQSYGQDAVHTGGAPRLFDRVAGKWRLSQYNVIDFEVGRKSWISRCFTLRPYAGLRGTWFKTKFRTTSTRSFATTTDTFDDNFKDRFTNRAWGVGFVAGVQPEWYFCQTFALYSNLDAALVWGEFKAKKRERYLTVDTVTATGVATNQINYRSSGSHNFYQMQGIIDLALGLRWTDTWCCDRYRTSLDFGWEHHLHLDTNHRIKTSEFHSQPGSSTDGQFGYYSYDEATGNLQLGGFVLRLRFDF